MKFNGFRANLFKLLIMFNIFIEVFTQTALLYCNQNYYSVSRNGQSVVLTFPNYPQLSVFNPASATLTGSSSFFTGLTITSCIMSKCDKSDGSGSCRGINSSLTCTLSTQTITFQPFGLTSGFDYSQVDITVNFSQTFMSITPADYPLNYVYGYSGTQYTCTSTISIANSIPTTLKMGLASGTTMAVESVAPFTITYQPQYDTNANAIQILINSVAYMRDFSDQSVTPWATSTITCPGITGSYSLNKGTCVGVTASYQCLAISVSSAYKFLSSTTYVFTITNFNYPFHPLGFEVVGLEARLNGYLVEKGSMSSSNVLVPSNFTPKSGTLTVKSQSFCVTAGNCSTTGTVAKQYSSISITIANPALLNSNTQLTLIFNTGYFIFSTSTYTVTASFASTTTVSSLFTLNQPSANQMQAVFTIPSRQFITSNDITFTISNVQMGLDTRSDYAYYLNAVCNAPSITTLTTLSGSQFQMSYSALSLSTASFTTLTVDNTNPFQIGQTSTYLFNMTPASSFTTTQMWFQITFPSTYTVNASGSSCYKVTLNNGLVSIAASSITEVSRVGKAFQISITIPPSTNVSQYSISTCNIVNPLQTGNSGSISAQANYNSVTYPSESGVATVTIVPAQFGSLTSIAPLDASQMTTQAANGYIFTLYLPVTQSAGNKLRLTFPPYFSQTSFALSASSAVFSSSSINTSSLYFEGVLQNAVSTSFTVSITGNNPPITNMAYTFTAEMYDVNSNIQLSKTISYSSSSYTPSAFGTFVFSRILSQNAAATSYTFQVQTKYFIDSTQNFFMRIQLDVSQAITSLTVTDQSSPIVLQNLTSKQTTDSSTYNYIDITAKYIAGFTQSSNFQTGFSFQISTITNYRSTKPLTLPIFTGVSSTSIGSQQTYTWTGNFAQSLSPSQVTLSSIATQYFATYSPYSFNIKFDIPIPQNGRVEITLPASTLSTTNPVPSITTSPSSGLFGLTLKNANTLKLTCQVQSCNNFVLTISSILNPTYSTFTTGLQPVLSSINTYDSDATDYIMQQVTFSGSSINYFNTCYTTQPYKSFCKDCTSQNVCTSCYQTASVFGTLYDTFDTTTNYCVSSCPSTTYLDTKQCLLCTNNCATCSSKTTCLSCAVGFYLQGTTCRSSCLATYYGDSNRVCQQCDQTKCLNCSGTATNCTSCQSGYGLITTGATSQCVVCASTTGYFDKNDGSGVCGVCSPQCKSCTGSSTNCQSCVDIYNGQPIYYNPTLSKCTTSCTTDGYNLLLTGDQYYCGLCTQSNQPCATCRNSPDFCTSCSSPLYLQSNKCVTKAEISIGFYGNDLTRSADACLNVCTSCVSSVVCTACISNFYLASGTCGSSCPSSLPIPDGQGGCKADTSSQITNLSDDNRVVPFPMLLACIAFSISIYFSKYEYSNTFVPGCVVGFCSLFEWISWLILIGTAASYQGIQSSAGILALLGFLFLYIINIVQFILMKKYIEVDPPFQEWILQNDKNKLCFRVIKYASLFISFKASRVIFSKYFNQGFFKAKVHGIDLFSSFNKLAIVSVFMNSGLIIIASAVVTYTYAKQSQGFFLGLDSLIVTIMMIIFMIWESLKKKEFFEEPVDLNQTFSQRFFPFEQSYMERMHSKALDNSARLNRGESNSSLADFKESKKVTIHENLQKPLTQVLDPSEMSSNAQIDKNVLKNSENGAPYLIQDQLCESYKPGGKRNFEKKHIAPHFDYSKHSNEDEMDDEENMDLKNSNQLFDNSNIMKNEKIENQRGFRGGNKQTSGLNGYYDENGVFHEYDEEEPVPLKPNTRHTIYYNENVQGMLNSQSTKGGAGSHLQRQEGVSLGVNMNDEEDEENIELRQKLYSKPNHDGMNIDQAMSQQLMRQSLSPKGSKGLDSAKPNKTEGENRSALKNNSNIYNSPSGKTKKKASNSKSRSISPSLAKVEDSKMKKSKSPKRQKSSNSDDDPNMRNSQTSNKSGKSAKSKKNSPKKSNSKGVEDDSMLFYFAHPVNGDQALPMKNNSQLKQSQQFNKDEDDENDENRVERIMPIEENLEDMNQKQVQPKYDMANQMKMKGPYSNDRAKVKGLLGLDGEDETEGKGQLDHYNGSQDIDRNIYDSSESVRTAEEAEMNYNEVSPSDFNVLNQRYEEDFFAIQMQQQLQRQQQQMPGSNILMNPDSLQMQSVQMGSVIQSPNNQLLGQQNSQMVHGTNSSRPPLVLENSHSNISIANPKTTKSAGGGKKKSKSKTRSSSKGNRMNISSQGHPLNPAILHQGLMTPSAGQAQGMRNSQGFLQQDNDALVQRNMSPAGSHRVGRGADIYQSGHSHHVRPNSQEHSDGFNRSNTQNMYNNTHNSKSGLPMNSKISGGGSRIGNISPSNSNQVITYKVPQSDVNKLKNLEKIYLQRLEIGNNGNTNNNNQAASSNKKPKKGKSNTNNNTYVTNNDFNDFDQQSVRSSQMNNYNGFYQPDGRQARDTSDIHAPSDILENRNSMVIADFGDDTAYKD